MKLNFFDKPGLRLRTGSFVSMLLCALAVAACATVPADTPENIVQHRAKARWDALIAGDIEAAYGYLPPSYRALHDFKQYRNSIGGTVQRKAAEVVRVECQPDVCAATIRIEAVVAPFVTASRTVTTHFEEKWIPEDGDWWVYQKD